MEQERCELNVAQLQKEFKAIELEGISADDIAAVLEQSSERTFSLSCKTRAGNIPLSVSVYGNPDPVTGLFTLSHYLVKAIEMGSFVHYEYKFAYQPWRVIRLDEAINLMHGRYIYRNPEVGPGYWTGLSWPKPSDQADVITFRNEFSVREHLAETGLGGWLSLTAWVKLVEELERGHRPELTVGTGTGMRVIKLEADPLKSRLKVMNRKGKELKEGKIQVI